MSPVSGFVNTASDANLTQGENVIIARGRKTEANTRPMWGLMEKFQHVQGSKQLTIPKWGETVAYDVTAGIEVTKSEQLLPTFINVSLKRIYTRVIILSDLQDQYSEDTQRVAGELSGEAMGTKEDKDAVALFSPLANALGADNKSLSLANANGCIGFANAGDVDTDGRRFGDKAGLAFVHHDNAIGYLRNSLTITGATYPIPSLKNWDVLKDYWAGFQISGVNFYGDNNITKVSAVDSGYGAIFHKKGLGVYRGQAIKPIKEYSSTLFASVVTWSERYQCFTIDSSRAASARYEMVDMTTDA